MRIAAGIIVALNGVIGLVAGIGLLLPDSQTVLGLLLLLWAGFLLIGAIFCFQRRYWGLCLAAAIVSFGILPIIFVCVRKGEWE